MALRAALVDRAYIRRNRAAERKVDGRRIYSSGWSPEIRARLTVSAASKRREDGRPMTEPRPTLILWRRDKAGARIDPRMTDRIRVESVELGTHLHEVDGEPQPIRKKRAVIGWTMTVRRLEENENPREVGA